MQIEHKTDKGTLLFQYLLIGSTYIQFEKDFNKGRLKHYKKDGWQLIGLTSDVTEEQAKMMVDVLWSGYMNYELKNKPVGNYNSYVKILPLESFKSLTQSLRVYEVNHYGKECPTHGFAHESEKQFTEVIFYAYIKKWKETESKTGKWIVLFKPNEK